MIFFLIYNKKPTKTLILSSKPMILKRGHRILHFAQRKLTFITKLQKLRVEWKQKQKRVINFIFSISNAFLFTLCISQLFRNSKIHCHEISHRENTDKSRHSELQILTKIMIKICRLPKKSIDLFPNFICEKVLPWKDA